MFLAPSRPQLKADQTWAEQGSLTLPRLVGGERQRPTVQGERRPEKPVPLQSPPHLNNFYSFLETCFKPHLVYEAFHLQAREPFPPSWGLRHHNCMSLMPVTFAGLGFPETILLFCFPVILLNLADIQGQGLVQGRGALDL